MAYLSPTVAPYFESICDAVDSEARAYEVRVRGEYMFDARTVLVDSEGSFEDDYFHLVEVLARLGVLSPCEPHEADSPQWVDGECYDRADVESIS
jgi:hypothetical protein